ARQQLRDALADRLGVAARVDRAVVGTHAVPAEFVAHLGQRTDLGRLRPAFEAVREDDRALHVATARIGQSAMLAFPPRHPPREDAPRRCWRSRIGPCRTRKGSNGAIPRPSTSWWSIAPNFRTLRWRARSASAST